ncbi:MAG: hypothetical protein MUF73_03755 [Rhodobacteraceae bacterium]|nr:hypothetical protein [Paracoccaceae bacterium]
MTPNPVPGNPNPTPPVQSGGGEDGGTVAAVSNPTSVIAGRVTTIEPVGGDNVAAIRILQHPAHGHLSVNPDNTLALVMTDSSHTGALSFRYETTLSNGTTAAHTTNLNVVAGSQQAGWSTGKDFYMLATDDDDNVIVEHGEVHRKVYVSGSPDALTRDDIAQLAGIRPDQVTNAWLIANPQYGGSEEMALDDSVAQGLWKELTFRQSSSHWLLLERGYTYDSIGRLAEYEASGESPMNPLYVGAWGEGTRPVVTQDQYSWQPNVVFQGLHFTGGLRILGGDGNVIIDDTMFTKQSLVVQEVPGVTVRNSHFFDIVRDAPQNTGATWDPGANRMTAFYVSGVDGLLIDGNVFDKIAYADNYRQDASVLGGQPPSMFSHALYIQYDNADVTLRDSIIMRGASQGVQVRSGGFVEDNAIIDNNVAMNTLGGDFANLGPTGHYSLVTDNVITSAGYRTVDVAQGAINWGYANGGRLTSMVDNIVAHMADPNNPAEVARKVWTGFAVDSPNPAFYNDTTVWNWSGQEKPSWTNNWRDANVEGLDPRVLNQTTIQKFTAALLGRETATIADLGTYLRAQANGAFDDVVDSDLIIRFFQAGFGLTPDGRLDAETLRFVPNAVGEGTRWDNRLNWDSGDLPGTVAGDSVHLGGNRVIFSGQTASVRDLEFGDRGGLSVTSGRLDVLDDLTVNRGVATLQISNVGQVWTEGYDGPGLLDIDQTGGRFVNTGNMRGQVDLTASGGQTVLASDDATFALTAGSRLNIVGDAGEVGFDGEEGGLAILGLGDRSTLAFAARDGRLGTIEEFRSGAFGDAPDVKSGIDLGNADLRIDLTGISGSTHSFTLMQVDELIGRLETASFTGLGSRNADIVIDYATDTVRLGLSSGNGAVGIRTVGAEGNVSAGFQDLWAALTAGRGTWDDVAPVEDEDDLDAVA